MTVVSDRLMTRVTARPSRRLAYLPVAALGIDLGLLVVTCVVAAVGRGTVGVFSGADVRANVGIAVPTLIALWLGVTILLGGYRGDVFGAGTDEYKRVLISGCGTAALLAMWCYLLKYPLSRGFFLLAFLLGLPLLIAGRALLRRAVYQARRRGALLQRVLIAGGPGHVDEIAAVLARESWLGYQVVGALTPSTYTQAATPSGIPVLGTCDDSHAIVDAAPEADVVFFTGGSPTSAGELRQIAWDLEDHDIQLVVAPSVTDISADRVRFRPVGGLPLVHLERPRWVRASRWAKRTFDVVGSLALLALTAPVMVVATLQVKLYDGGPVLFRQDRVGRDGRMFGCFKLRTMVVDAEALLPQLISSSSEAIEGLFKMKDDPRITRPGKWLRRFSIDELPQLLNVLRGDMSLVGPRPQLPSEAARMDDVGCRRQRVRPGMTGLWQVSGRSDLSWEEAIRLDLYYVDNWSMVQDLNILTKTLGAVVGRRGAY